jgi:hypothetical protein
MVSIRFLLSARNIAAALLLSTQLVACIGSEEATTADDISDNLALSGNVGDGPVVFASMRILQNNGVEIASFESDANANYLVNVSTTLQYYPLIIESTGGTDIVTNLPPDFVLESAVFAPASRRVANVNPFSTYVVAMARQMPGGISGTNLQSAQSTVSSVMNGGLDSLASSGSMVTHIDESNITEIVKSSETVAESIRRTRDLLNAFGYPTNGDQVIRAIASDIVDGVLDGRGNTNTNARTSAVMTIVTAQVYLESMANELFVNGSDATAAIEQAISQISARTPTSMLEDQIATREMIEAARTGLAAALALGDDSRIAALHASTSGLQHGMKPSLVRTFLPSDYRTALEAALSAVAGGNNAVIDMINDIARSGGDINGDNRAPSIGGTVPRSVMVGSSYSFTPSAADPDGDTLTFSITNLPSWATFDSNNGRLSGTPGDADAGTYSNIQISVSDGEFSASLAAFSINVSMTNAAPSISGTPATSITIGNNYSFTPSATDPDGDTLTFSIANRPGWATFNNSNGLLSGTPGPMDAGTYSGISISVSDGVASASLNTFSISVQSAANSAPSISGTPSTSAVAGTAYSFTPTASDPDGDTLTFSISGLPSWANFNASTGRISGTPAAGDVGVYSNIQITATDGSLSDTLAAFSITVDAVGTSSVTLNWAAPTENEDGSALADLAGYKLYWGTTPGTYPNSVTISNASISSYVVENLAPGTYQFVATSFNAAGEESSYSNLATKVVP